MCGIAGVIGYSPDRIACMKRMLHVQKHRGPDASSYAVLSDEVLLGHNRLSIIDLNESAHQPMHSADGRFTIVFNGEIYNYKELRAELQDYDFRTQSDTEVLLAAYSRWGRDCLHKLNGMFAFAIWNRQTNECWAARDRFGVKPFYYASVNNAFVFASEINTIFATGFFAQPDEKVWASFFAFGSYGSPVETFWKGIHQLPAGHWMSIRDGAMEIKQWYFFEESVNGLMQADDASWQQQYSQWLAEAVAFRFRADVPVGFNLSGGLDSSLLLALVQQLYPYNTSIEAFSFTTGHSYYDELPWVNEMLASTGYALNDCRLMSDEVPGLALQIARHQQEPYGGLPTIAYSKLFKAARDKGILVLLDGQGMDEAWAGYDYYTHNSDALVQGAKTSPVMPGALFHDFLDMAEKPFYPVPFEDAIQNLQYRDLFYTKLPRVLRFNDRVSMLHSTELREPFLDYRLVELAFSRPVEQKLKEGQSKWFLRSIAKDLLGNKLALAPKRAVQTPQREWLAGDLKEWAGDMIDIFSKTGWANPVKVKAAWNAYLKGDYDNSFFIWQWINTALIFSGADNNCKQGRLKNESVIAAEA